MACKNKGSTRCSLYSPDALAAVQPSARWRAQRRHPYHRRVKRPLACTLVALAAPLRAVPIDGLATLVGRIEGQQDGRARGIHFPMKRVACPAAAR
jgi:hypothetical protein